MPLWPQYPHTGQGPAGGGCHTEWPGVARGGWAVIGKIFCSVLSNRITSHMQVTGLEAQCVFMPGKSKVDAIYTMRALMVLDFGRVINLPQ